jgi:16S rRNA (guanine966-N2)-methyltransferase
VRVIAGSAKGLPLKAPHRPQTRPVTDLVRGAIFSILANQAVNWERVLDLFAGSGALGIEALSRGAGWADFVEHEPVCCAIIKQNLAKTGFTGCSHVYCANVQKALTYLDKTYDIILMDPPYASMATAEIILKLGASSLLGPQSVLVLTHSPRFEMPSKLTPLHIFKEHRYGDSCVTLFRKEDSL